MPIWGPLHLPEFRPLCVKISDFAARLSAIRGYKDTVDLTKGTNFHMADWSSPGELVQATPTSSPRRPLEHYLGNQQFHRYLRSTFRAGLDLSKPDRQLQVIAKLTRRSGRTPRSSSAITWTSHNNQLLRTLRAVQPLNSGVSPPTIGYKSGLLKRACAPPLSCSGSSYTSAFSIYLLPRQAPEDLTFFVPASNSINYDCAGLGCKQLV